jgi:hypothetical protein
MRVSVFRREETATQRMPPPDPEIRSGSRRVDPGPESVDEQIESLLVSLQETDVEDVDPYPAPYQPVRSRPKRRARRRRRLISRYDLAFTVTAVVLGLAVGALTVLLLNG